MIQKTDISWNNEYQHDGFLYFAQRIVEMLDYDTVDIYRAPLMNTPRLINEYLRIIDGHAKEYHLQEVFNEFKNSFSSDVIIQYKLGEQRIEQILDKLNASPENRADILEYLYHSISTQYLKWTKEYLEYIVPQNNKKRKIEQAVRCLIPELLKCGYSREDIYHSAKLLLTDEVDPASALSNFLSAFDCKKKEYSVYFQLSQKLLQFEEIFKSRLNISFEDDGHFDKLDSRDNYCKARITGIKALDASTAANQVVKALELFTSFYQYFGHYNNPLISRQVLVISEDESERYPIVNRSKFRSKENENTPQMGEISEAIITRLMKSAQCSISKLKKNAELHNRALANNGLENGFLNLWSIMEMICVTNPEKSKIEQVKNVTVPILKRDYLPCIFKDIGENLKNLIPSEEFDSLMDSIDEEGDYYEKLAYYIMLPKYSEHFNSFVDCLVCYPVLRSRMINLHDECTKRKDLHRIIDHYGQRVSWHLYRVYRARNTITHSGRRPNDLKDLGEHLHSYVDRLANETIVKLSMGSLCHISNILIDSELQQEEWESYLKKSDRIDEQCIQKIFDPQTIMWNYVE